MNRISFLKASDVFLVTLWVLVLLFLGAVFAGTQRPHLIESVDGYFRDRYLVEPPRRYAKMISAYEQDGDDTGLVGKLVKLAEDLEPIQKGDELVATKRVVYAQLVDVLVRTGDYPSAGVWVERWLAFDSRDVTALLRKGRLLVIDPESYPEGELLLEVLKHRFPTSLVIADGRANAWASIGQLGRAFSEYVPFLEHQKPQSVTFGTLMQPRFSPLIIEQLRQGGHLEDIEVYEALLARP